MTYKSLIRRFVFFVVTTIFFIPLTVLSAGFALMEHNASGNGNAYAGAAVVAEDASTLHFNPAGLSILNKQQLSISSQVLFISASFDDSGSTLNPLLTGGSTPIPSNDNNDGGENAIVPNIYYVAPINDQYMWGIGVTVPFGLATKYDEGWAGRYHAVESSVKTINVNPSIAYKVNDKLSLGAGINMQYIDVKLSNMVDSAAVCLGAVGAATCNAISPSLTQAGNSAIDSKVSLTGTDWAMGYNFGVIYQPSNTYRVGFSYRSKVSYDIDGDAEFNNSAAMQAFLTAASSPFFSDGKANAKMDLPENASIAIFGKVSNKISLFGDVTWTRWSRFDKLLVEFENGQPDSEIPENWKNSVKFAFGGNYILDDKWTLKAGIGYDKTPIPDNEHRTARIPANDRKVLSFGAKYNASEKVNIDFGYTHLFIDDPEIDNTDSSFGHTLSGSYSSTVDIIGVQCTWDI